ncbi:MAG TPA: hypothetical protein VHG72_19645 [Polyangia bacterium]|nr:hypothetical protein [Polyangia bacterium]
MLKPVAILAVALAGVALVFEVVHHHTGRQPQGRDRSSEVATSSRAPDPQAQSLDRFRLAEIENRLSAIEGNAAAKQPPAAAVPPHRPTPEERTQQIKQDFDDQQKRIDQSKTELRNDSWATPMEQRINSMFQSIPSSVKARYGGVDCRSTTCTVNFSWPSRQAAESEMRLVVGTLARTGCARSLALGPVGGEADAAGQVLLTCGDPAGAPAPLAGR